MFSPTKIALLLSGLFTGLAANAVPMANRNLFIDGALDQWTANSASVSNAGVTYVAPTMWKLYAGAGGAATVSKQDLRTNAFLANSDSGAANYLQWQQTTNSTGTVAGRNAPLICQFMEGLRKYAGRSVTLQVKLWASAPLTIPGIIATQSFGTGGSPSTSVTFDKNVSWSVTTTPKKFSVRMDVPNIVGKALGTNGDDALQLGIYLPVGSTYTLNAMEFQCELCDPASLNDLNGAGGAPTVFEYRGEQAELARVLRFYNPGNSTRMELVNTNYFGATHRFQTPMRAAPAVSVTDGVGAAGKYTSASGGNGRTPSGGSLAQNPSTLGFETDALAQATGEGNWALIAWTADARL